MNIKVAHPKLAGSNLALSPLQIPRITPADGGIDLNHREAGQVPFSAVRLASVFAKDDGGMTPYRLMLFLDGHRRPFVAAANAIHYQAFPFPHAETLVPQLRAFVRYLFDNHPSLAVDRQTYDFLLGKMPERLTQEVVILATALSELLSQVDEVDA